MASGTTTEQIIDVVTPSAGESVSEGTILEWHVKVGDFIKANETIVEISTDKVDIELPAPASGTVSEILIQEGETVTVGQVIARIAAADAHTDDGAPAPAAGSQGEQAQRSPEPPEPQQIDGPAASEQAPSPQPQRDESGDGSSAAAGVAQARDGAK